jgi:hypothetical protein
MSSVSDLPALIVRYARQFDAALPGHRVASPLGAWLLLALAAPALDGPEAKQVEAILGCSADESSAAATALLGAPHDAVKAAAAVWTRQARLGSTLRTWSRMLAAVIDAGEIPSLDEAGRWACERTDGLIADFPVTPTADTVVLLASALATKVTWLEPFELIAAADLGAGPWAASLTTALRSPAGHDAFIAETSDAGRAAVHIATAQEGLIVVSVIAGSDITAGDALAAAHRIASDLEGVPRVSLYDLPIGDGHAWTVVEGEATAFAGESRIEHCDAVLPAWKACSEHDLMRQADFGFIAGSAGLVRLIPPDPRGSAIAARQSAVASYDRLGFEAAAVTAWGVRAGAAPVKPVTVPARRGRLRFGRPYAVVAAAVDRRWDASSGGELLGPWHQLPVFSAWVEETQDAQLD